MEKEARESNKKVLDLAEKDLQKNVYIKQRLKEQREIFKHHIIKNIQSVKQREGASRTDRFLDKRNASLVLN